MASQLDGCSFAILTNLASWLVGQLVGPFAGRPARGQQNTPALTYTRLESAIRQLVRPFRSRFHSSTCFAPSDVSGPSGALVSPFLLMESETNFRVTQQQQITPLMTATKVAVGEWQTCVRERRLYNRARYSFSQNAPFTRWLGPSRMFAHRSTSSTWQT